MTHCKSTYDVFASIFTTKVVGLEMTYGKRLNQALEATKKSRKQLASELGCSVQAIGMVITGAGGIERTLSALNNVKAAKFLRVDSYWLATGEGEMTLGASGGKTANLSNDALDLAIYFDKITDDGDRTIAYVAAMAEILKVLAARDAKSSAPTTRAPSVLVSPKKQDA